VLVAEEVQDEQGPSSCSWSRSASKFKEAADPEARPGFRPTALGAPSLRGPSSHPSPSSRPPAASSGYHTRRGHEVLIRLGSLPPRPSATTRPAISYHYYGLSDTTTTVSLTFSLCPCPCLRTHTSTGAGGYYIIHTSGLSCRDRDTLEKRSRWRRSYWDERHAGCEELCCICG
jgi:hypothetical protein